MDHLKYKLLADLVQAMLDNDPDELVADGGVTMLDVWRKDARRLLGPSGPRTRMNLRIDPRLSFGSTEGTLRISLQKPETPY